MSKQTDKTLFMVSSMPRLYQSLLAGISNYQELGERVLREIKAAHAFRRIEQVRELARVLINIPIKEYQLIAQYYLVWCKCRDYQYPAEVLERIIEQTDTYKTKGFISRAAFEIYQGNTEEALYFYTQAFKTQRSVSDYIEASRGVALVKSLEGFNKSALTDLETLIPILRYAEPHIYYYVLNSYAVELKEAGRIQEAENVSRIVLASPFAPAYPEWQDTGIELGFKPSRSFVSVDASMESPVTAKPEPEPSIKPESEPKPTSVLNFKLQEAPPPEKPEKVTPEEIERMNSYDKREFLLAALRSGAVKERNYTKLIIMAGLLDSGPAVNEIDLEDEALVEDIIIDWCNLIKPEQFAAVISALRDCKDDWRRTHIMDTMISRAFEQSRERVTTETEWRLKFECKLPIK